MARFFSREEWPLIVAGIIAGVLTSALVLYVFFTGLGGEAGPDTTLLEDSAAVARAARRTDRAPIIGAREAGIRRRLDAVTVSARPVRGPLSVTLRNVVWNDRAGGRFARVELATARMQLNAVRAGDVVLEDVVIRRPVLTLRESGSGTWNYEPMLLQLRTGNGNGAGGDSNRRIELRRVRIADGDVDITRPAQRLGFRNVQASLAHVTLSGPGVAAPFLRAERVTAQLVRPEQPVVAVEVSDARVEFPDGTVRFNIAAAMLDRTRVAAVTGSWNPADPGFGITASGRALAVNFADIRSFAPAGFPEEGTASFRWRVRPVAAQRTEITLEELESRSGSSRIAGSFTVLIGGTTPELRSADLRLDPLALSLVEAFTGSLPYGGSIAGRVTGTEGNINFDVVANLTASTTPRPFRAELTGQLRMLAGGGFALQQLDANLTRVPLAALRAVTPGLPIEGLVTGRVSLRGSPDTAPLDLNVRLEMGNGVALVEGTVDLTGAVPSYDLSGRLLGVDLQSVLQPKVPPVALTARFALRGSGTEPATMNASMRVAGRFTGWRSTSSDTVHLVATMRAGTLDVDTLVAKLATAHVVAQGEWQFVEPQRGALTYAVDVRDFAPFGPYVPLLGDTVAAGSLRADGSIAGTLSRMTLTGEATGGSLRFGGWQATTLTAQYEVTTGGGQLPVARVTATGRDLVTPTAGTFADGEFRLELTPPALAFELKANRERGGLMHVVATGDIPESGTKTVYVQQARFDLENDTWALVRPATIRWTDDGATSIQGLELAAEGREGRLLVDGVILPFGRIDMRLQVAALPAADVQRLLGQPARLEGMLWAEGTIRGGTESPLVDLDFRVENGALQDVALQRFQGQLVYRNNLTELDAQLVVDSAGQLDVTARLPSRLSLGAEAGFELLDSGPLSALVTARHFALAPLAVAYPRLRDVTGHVDARVELSGTAAAPRVAGTLTLQEGALTVPELNQRFTEITGNIGFNGERLVVNDVRARSDGWLTVSGDIVLERLDEPVFNLTANFDEFRPMGVEDQRDAALFGSVAITGPLDAMQMTGAVTVEDGYFVIPQFGGARVRTPLADMTQPASVIGRELGAPVQTSWLRNLAVRNLRVQIGEGVWFQTEEARVQLAGELTISKHGENTPIVGALRGTRGQYTLVAGPIVRRFQIVDAQVRFLGSPTPNPQIDITARRIVIDAQGRNLDVDVRITGTLERPVLALAGGAGAPVAESELLSFLLFGQPSFALGEGGILPGDQILGQTFVGGFWELTALELERSLGGLGLDIFEIRLGQGTFGGITSPTFVFGRQLSDEIFLTVETGLASLFGEGETTLAGWAMRLDWAIDRRSRARLAYEPVYRGRSFRSAGLALPLSDPVQQWLVEYRRRWTY